MDETTYGIQLPPPPMVSMNPIGQYQSQQPQVDTTLGAAGIPGTPEARGQSWVNNQPDYQAAHELLTDLRSHAAKRQDLENRITALSKQAGYDMLSDPDKAAADLADQAASNFGGKGGLLTRALTFHSRQQAAHQAAARAQAAQGVQFMKMIADLHDKGDQQQLDEVAKYLQLGGDTRDMVKTYMANDDRDQKIKDAEKRQADIEAIKQKAEARLEGLAKARTNHLAIQDEALKLMSPLQRQQLQAKINQLGLQNEFLPYLDTSLINQRNTNTALAPFRAQTQEVQATQGMPTNPNVPTVKPFSLTRKPQAPQGAVSPSTQLTVPPPAAPATGAVLGPANYGIKINSDGSVALSPAAQTKQDAAAANTAHTKTVTQIEQEKQARSRALLKASGIELPATQAPQQQPTPAAHPGQRLSPAERQRLIEQLKAKGQNGG